MCFRRNEVCSVPLQVWSRPRSLLRGKIGQNRIFWIFIFLKGRSTGWVSQIYRCSLTFEDTLVVWNRPSQIFKKIHHSSAKSNVKIFCSGIPAILGDQGEACFSLYIIINTCDVIYVAVKCFPKNMTNFDSFNVWINEATGSMLFTLNGCPTCCWWELMAAFSETLLLNPTSTTRPNNIGQCEHFCHVTMSLYEAVWKKIVFHVTATWWRLWHFSLKIFWTNRNQCPIYHAFLPKTWILKCHWWPS